MESFPERYTVVADGCWIWDKVDATTGYGRADRSTWAHRLSHELHVGPIPTGFQIDHLCRVRACVNPEHLEAVTQRENILRGQAPTILTHVEGICRRGHVLTGENRAPNGPAGQYTCRPCKRERERARHQRLREAAKS